MPGAVTGPGVIAGFYGKVPARGDFVRAGLPRDFTDPWDDWLQTVIAGSRVQMGEDWLPAYLESPVWRFVLPMGLCGTFAAMGVMMPSVDKAGRYFPLTLAALDNRDAFDMNDGWLDRAEDAGIAALEKDVSPESLSLMLGSPPVAIEPAAILSASLWWTDGAPRVPATRLTLARLPDITTYASMLGARRDYGSVPDDANAWQDVSREAPS